MKKSDQMALKQENNHALRHVPSLNILENRAPILKFISKNTENGKNHKIFDLNLKNQKNENHFQSGEKSKDKNNISNQNQSHRLLSHFQAKRIDYKSSFIETTENTTKNLNLFKNSNLKEENFKSKIVTKFFQNEFKNEEKKPKMTNIQNSENNNQMNNNYLKEISKSSKKEKSMDKIMNNFENKPTKLTNKTSLLEIKESSKNEPLQKDQKSLKVKFDDSFDDLSKIKVENEKSINNSLQTEKFILNKNPKASLISQIQEQILTIEKIGIESFKYENILSNRRIDKKSNAQNDKLSIINHKYTCSDFNQKEINIIKSDFEDDKKMSLNIKRAKLKKDDHLRCISPPQNQSSKNNLTNLMIDRKDSENNRNIEENECLMFKNSFENNKKMKNQQNLILKNQNMFSSPQLDVEKLNILKNDVLKFCSPQILNINDKNGVQNRYQNFMNMVSSSKVIDEDSFQLKMHSNNINKAETSRYGDNSRGILKETICVYRPNIFKDKQKFDSKLIEGKMAEKKTTVVEKHEMINKDRIIKKSNTMIDILENKSEKQIIEQKKENDQILRFIEKLEDEKLIQKVWFKFWFEASKMKKKLKITEKKQENERYSKNKYNFSSFLKNPVNVKNIFQFKKDNLSQNLISVEKDDQIYDENNQNLIKNMFLLKKLFLLKTYFFLSDSKSNFDSKMIELKKILSDLRKQGVLIDDRRINTERIPKSEIYDKSLIDQKFYKKPNNSNIDDPFKAFENKCSLMSFVEPNNSTPKLKSLNDFLEKNNKNYKVKQDRIFYHKDYSFRIDKTSKIKTTETIEVNQNFDQMSKCSPVCITSPTKFFFKQMSELEKLKYSSNAKRV